MRVLYVDIDSLRPDHLGCYGYARHTSPTIDRVARLGVRFNNCYTSDAPCLPSRTALVTGRPGIHTGVVNHGGTASEPFRAGPARGLNTPADRRSLFECLHDAGFHTTSISSFPRRHAAWHFLAGLDEYHDSGHSGNETAGQVNARLLPWLRDNAKRDNWFLHVNYWDPHRPYRTPAEYGEPFAGQPIPAWMTESIRQRHWEGTGLQSARDPNDGTDQSRWPRMPGAIASMDDYRRWIDAYDTGIRYADDHLGQALAVLDDAGVLHETAVIITADHGENHGELNYYGAHRTGDHVTHRVPLIVAWPGRAPQARPKAALHYQFDLSATILDLCGAPQPKLWQGRSFAGDLGSDTDAGRDFLVLSQMACMCQRSVRFDNWIYLRTWHDGFSRFPARMLFDLHADPHETQDLAPTRPDLVQRGQRLLDQWHAEMMASHPAPQPIDPMQTGLQEDPFHANAAAREKYCQRLRETGRSEQAGEIERTRGLVS
jgi:arylsulfatase A-like enzyme